MGPLSPDEGATNGCKTGIIRKKKEFHAMLFSRITDHCHRHTIPFSVHGRTKDGGRRGEGNCYHSLNDIIGACYTHSFTKIEHCQNASTSANAQRLKRKKN